MDTRTSILSFIDDLSILSDAPHSDFPKEKIIFCPECWDIPELFLDEKANKLTSICSTNHHHNENTLSDFIKKCTEHSLSNVICKICRCSSILSTNIQESSKKNFLNQFYYCEKCNEFYCTKCERIHNKLKRSHLVKTLTLLSIICSYHNYSYSGFCKTCNQNICNKCIVLHNNHEIIRFNEIKQEPQEINRKKSEIEKEKTELKKVEIIFKDAINDIYNKFNDLMKYRNEILWLKENIIMTYEMKNNNYNSIQNFNKLNMKFQEFKNNFESPFDSKDDNSMSILTIQKIFDYLENTEKFSNKIFLNKTKTRNKSLNKSEKKQKNDNEYDTNTYSKYKTPEITLEKRIGKKHFKDIEENDFTKNNLYRYTENDIIDFRPEEEEYGKHSTISHRKGKDYYLKKIGDIPKKKIRKYSNKSNEKNKNEDVFYREYEKVDQVGIGKHKNKSNKEQIKTRINRSTNLRNNIPKYEKKIIKEKQLQNSPCSSFNYVKKIKIKSTDSGKKIKKDDEYDIEEDNDESVFSRTDNMKIRKVKNNYSALSFRKKSKINNDIPKVVRSLNDNRKEIMNMILLHDGNFCTSSWDGSIKIFDSKTFKILLIIDDQNNDDVCYVNQLNDDSIILCSVKIYKYRLYNNDTKYTLQTTLGGYKDYIIKVIELKDDTLVSCDWEYNIKIWKRISHNDNDKIQYQLIKSDLNSGEHLCSICPVNDYEFACSSNSHLEKGNDVLRFFDSNYEINFNIYDISCSELVDTLCQLNKQFFCVALQKWKNNQIKGLAIIDMYEKRIFKIIKGDSMTCLTKLSNNILLSGGRDNIEKQSYIHLWKFYEDGSLSEEYDVCTEQKDAITSIIQLDDGTFLASNYDSSIMVLK